MDIPTEILKNLKCSSCELYLSRGPVYLLHDGAAVCGRCYTPKRPATRNTQYEATAKLLKFPCKNRELGCSVTVPYVEQDEEIAHEEMCEHRQYVCPVLGSARCDWLGSRAAMLAHCSDQHLDNVLENPCSLTHDIARSSLHNYIILAFQVLFILHTKICLETGKIFHAIRLLGGADEAANYHFTLDIKRNDRLVLMAGSVAPQGCLAIQEDTSLSLNTNSLLDMLDGFDGTSFTVTVKRRVSDADEQLARTAEKCGQCKPEMAVDITRSEATFRFTVPDFSKLKVGDSVYSSPFYVRNLPWKLNVDRQTQSSFAVYLVCNDESDSSSWSCSAVAELRLCSHKPDVVTFCHKIQHLFSSEEDNWGFPNFMEWQDVLKPENGYLKHDSITVEVHVVAEEPHI